MGIGIPQKPTNGIELVLEWDIHTGQIILWRQPNILPGENLMRFRTVEGKEGCMFRWPIETVWQSQDDSIYCQKFLVNICFPR